MIEYYDAVAAAHGVDHAREEEAAEPRPEEPKVTVI